MGHYDKIEIAGMSTKEVAEILGYKQTVSVWEKVDAGWTDDEILNYKPKFKTKGKSKHRFPYKGKEYDLFGLAEISGLSYDILYTRLLVNKKSVEWSVETPHVKGKKGYHSKRFPNRRRQRRI